MGNVLSVGLFLVAAGLLGYISYLAISFAAKLASLNAYKAEKGTSKPLHDAHKYATWASVAGVVGLVATITLVVVVFVGGAYAGNPTLAFKFTNIFLVLILGILLTAGILMAIATSKFHNNPAFHGSDSTMKSIYNDGILASVLSIGAIGLLIIVGVYLYVSKKRAFKKRQLAEADVAAQIIKAQSKTSPSVSSSSTPPVATG